MKMNEKEFYKGIDLQGEISEKRASPPRRAGPSPCKQHLSQVNLLSIYICMHVCMYVCMILKK